MLPEHLLGLLRSAGIDPGDVTDAGKTWSRLHDLFGRRVTLIDRYDLEAAEAWAAATGWTP